MTEVRRLWMPALLGVVLTLAAVGAVIWLLPQRQPAPKQVPVAVPLPLPATTQPEAPVVEAERRRGHRGQPALDRRSRRHGRAPPGSAARGARAVPTTIWIMASPRASRPSMRREFERRLNRRFQTGARPIRVVFVPVVRDELLPGLIAARATSQRRT